MTDAEFWQCTLRDLARELVVARFRLIDEHNRDVRIAWWIARLSRAETVPPLDRLTIRDRRERRAQSTKGIAAALAVLSAQYNIPLRRRGPRTGGQ